MMRQLISNENLKKLKREMYRQIFRTRNPLDHPIDFDTKFAQRFPLPSPPTQNAKETDVDLFETKQLRHQEAILVDEIFNALNNLQKVYDVYNLHELWTHDADNPLSKDPELFGLMSDNMNIAYNNVLHKFQKAINFYGKKHRKLIQDYIFNGFKPSSEPEDDILHELEEKSDFLKNIKRDTIISTIRLKLNNHIIEASSRKQKAIMKLKHANTKQHHAQFKHFVFITLCVIALPIELLASNSSRCNIYLYAAPKKTSDNPQSSNSSKNKYSLWGSIKKHYKKFKKAGEKIKDNNKQILQIKTTI